MKYYYYVFVLLFKFVISEQDVTQWQEARAVLGARQWSTATMAALGRDNSLQQRWQRITQWQHQGWWSQKTM